MNKPNKGDTRRPRARRSILGLLAAAPVAAGAAWISPGVSAALSFSSGGTRSGITSTNSELQEKIRQIVGRPEFKGTWGLKFISLDTGELICAHNPAEPHNPGSSAKVFIAGTAFEELGADYRFNTRIYGTGPVRHGVLDGDLVLVAGGDLLLGGRIQPDGSIALPSPDHGYARGADTEHRPLPGDPLRSIRELAGQVAAHGVRRITGHVLVDTSLFRQKPEPAGGFPIIASPVMINDNVVDITITPGRHVGAPARLNDSPRTAYLRIVNKIRTIAASELESGEPVKISEDAAQPDGTRVVTLTGDIPAGAEPRLYAYHIPDPGRFAEFALAKALRSKGIHADPAPVAQEREAAGTHREVLLAQLQSPPLSDEVKPMLRVSSNPHAANLPYVVGAIAGGEAEETKEAYEKLRSSLFAEAGLDPYPPGSEEDEYSANFFVTFLAHINRKPYFPRFLEALSSRNAEDSPVAGHMFGKGGGGSWSRDGQAGIHKAIVGYLKPPGGQTIGFAVLTEQPAASPDPEHVKELEEQAKAALQDILTTVYDAIA